MPKEGQAQLSTLSRDTYTLSVLDLALPWHLGAGTVFA